MYDEGEGIAAVEQPSDARTLMLEYLESIAFDPSRVDVEHLVGLLRAEDGQIRIKRRN